MLGASSRVLGVQSYSESSKKSSSLEVISDVMRSSARDSVAPSDAEAVRVMAPPRWADLRGSEVSDPGGEAVVKRTGDW